MAQSVDDVLDELGRKEDALVLAARYGKDLLEEKEKLQIELDIARQELKHLEEVLQSQKHDAQRSLLQSKTEADELITDLERRLTSVTKSFEEEQIKYTDMKEEYQKTLVGLHSENSKLRVELNKLSGEKRQENEKCRKVSKALKESENLGHISTIEHEELQKQVDTLKTSNRSYSNDVSTLAHTCDKLSDDLQTNKIQLEYWEKQYTQLNEEFVCQAKELGDSQEIIRQLQLELGHQRSAPPTPTSTMSLHDELSQSINSLDMLRLSPDCLSRHGSDNNSTEHSVDEPDFNQSVTGTLRVSDHPQTLSAWSTDSEDSEYPCQRCKKLTGKIIGYKQELDSVSEQLLIAVQQKIKLQEQNEAWQSDMADLVEQNLHQKLDEDTSKKKKKGAKRKTNSSSESKSDHLFKHHFIKDSWLF